MQYKYKAFISYNHRDKRMARWLQRRLEAYILPSVIVNDKGESIYSNGEKVKYKIFRYETDLVAQNLNDGLRAELDNSQYLIVLCSPNSASSEWVGKEIKHFLETGRAKNIIPFIICGTPYSNGSDECFHPILKRYFGASLLGVDINDASGTYWFLAKRRAIAKLVSLLVEIPNAYEYLWNRYKQRLYFGYAMRFLAVLIIILLVVGGWTYNHEFKTTIFFNELTPHNKYLPPLDSLKISLKIGDDVYERGINDSTKCVQISDIPRKKYGTMVTLSFRCEGYINLDTIVELKDRVVVTVLRDIERYGRVRFSLRDENGAVKYEPLMINNISVNTDSNGNVDTIIPIEDQRTVYKIKSKHFNMKEDSIYPPFNRYRIVEVEY